LSLVRLHERREHVQSVASRRPTLGGPEALDLLQRPSVVPASSNGSAIHGSNLLSVDVVVLDVRADEADEHDPEVVPDRHDQALLVSANVEANPTMLEDAPRFTSALAA